MNNEYMKDSQHYSKIARDYIYRLREKEGPYYDGVYLGDLNMMENLSDLFGWDRSKDKDIVDRYNIGGLHRARFQFVLNKLDRESKKPDAIFKKMYISYAGIINRPTRCFVLKEFRE